MTSCLFFSFELVIGAVAFALGILIGVLAILGILTLDLLVHRGRDRTDEGDEPWYEGAEAVR